MTQTQRNTIWLVDDNQGFLTALQSILLARLPSTYVLQAVDSAKDVDNLKQGDVLVLDQHGCDSDFLVNKTEGVEVIRISGDPDLADKIDLMKPFSPNDLISLVLEKINTVKAAA